MRDQLGAARKKPRLVGTYIRKRREALGISQRVLGQKFQPAVTTQFISNVERGVTPLPPGHVPTLANALRVTEGELMSILEKEYAAKLSGRLGVDQTADGSLVVGPEDVDLIRRIYESYKNASDEEKLAFKNAVQNIFRVQLEAEAR